MKYRCLTNNPYIIKRCFVNVEPFKGTPLELLSRVKAEVLDGYRLITHPLTGSIGPYINPYKSIILDTKKGLLDEESLELIEKAINHTQYLLPDYQKCIWDDGSRLDLQYLDFDFVKVFI